MDRKRTVPDWFKRTQAIQARINEIRADLADHADLGAMAGSAGTAACTAHTPSNSVMLRRRCSLRRRLPMLSQCR